ncbi:hyou1 [Symbiodinium sp. CCMP2592]|nr:hyou1 [Symbiodinium sp. CCMP2592]
MDLANLYTALGVSVSAGEADIRSAYRRRALATHPDKGGSAEAFRLVVKAFETLADPRRRARKLGTREQDGIARASAPAQEEMPARGAEGDRSTGSPAQEDIPKLAKELLRLSLTFIRARLKKLVLEVLRELLTFLETAGVQAASEFGEDEDENSASASEDDPEDVLPLCDDECPDLVCEDELESETKLQPDCRGPGRSGLRGVTLHHFRGKKSYRAKVGFKGIIAQSQYCSNLDTVIDFHMSLVQMRHRFLKECEAGKPFDQALDIATEQLHREKEGADAPKMRLSFLCARVTGGRKVNLDGMKLVWQAYQEALAMGREEKLLRLHQRAQERADRKQERRESKHTAKVQALHTALQAELQMRAQRLLEKQTQQAFGVKTLPQSIVLTSLPGVPQLNTCMCAQLQLKDGSLCQGPLRASLVLAKRDVKELSAIREAKGDDAVKEEASRRDADVMTSFFMTGRLAQIMSVDLGHEFFKALFLALSWAVMVPLEIVLNSHSKRKTSTAVSYFEASRVFGDDALAHVGKAPTKVPLFFHNTLGQNFTSEADVQTGGAWWKEFGLSELFYKYDLGYDEERGVPTFKLGDMVAEGEEVLASIFAFAKKMSEDSADGKSVRDLVVTVPNDASLRQRQAIVSAGEIAGCRVLTLVHETSAFAVQRAVDVTPEKGASEVHLFYNLGSRKAEATLVRFESRSAGMVAGKMAPVLTVLGSSIDHGIGGHLFDLKVADAMLKKFQEKFPKLADGVVKNPRALRKLLSQAQKTKTTLSANKAAPFTVESLFEDTDFQAMLKREDFEAMCKDMFERLTQPIEKALAEANLTVADINFVEVVGGAWRIPMIQPRPK